MSTEAAFGGFAHLRVHSAYSLLEGAIPVKALPGLCARHGMPAVGVADAGNLFGALEFSETAAKAGVQPIIGCQLALAYAPPPALGEKPTPPAPIVLYAQTERGYENLMALTSHAFLTAEEAAPQIDWAVLEARSEGLICLSGGPDGPIGRRLRLGRTAEAEAVAARLAAAFPDRFYLEIHRHGTDGALRTEVETATEPGFLALAQSADLPIVAINEVFFPEATFHEAHDALLCISDGRYVSEEDRRRLTPEHWFKPPELMRERFQDLPEAIENTLEIAERCAFRPRTRAPILPRFADDEVAELRRQAREGLEGRFRELEASGAGLAAPRAEYEARLDFELCIIERMGFPGYFLIVADFIKWAKDHDIPVGPGRGSGAGSLVAYVLTITNLDPLRYQLLFERFLNPERVSMPDFDIDFCQDRREEVIRYVQEKYGHDKVAQIITFGALLSKAAVRDVGRVLQMSFGQVDRIAKLIPIEGVKPVSVKQARKDEPRLGEAAAAEPVVGRLLDVAEQVEGLFRNASTHAAGVVIGDRPLEQLTPLYRDPRSDMPVTQFNMKWVEQAGLVKFDFLGLKTLTIIQNAVDLLKARGLEIDIDAIPIDDPATYALYSRADTVAVFQVESSGMRDALRQLKPTCIEDIIALVALYRPGPMENIPKYCNVKHGREEPDYLHPMLEPILKETQGIIVYQEQVMQIAQVMAGYSLGQADLLRRAMGKKIKEAMDEERPKFLDGAAKNGVDKAKAQEVWDLLEKFANYGFNKSHAAAYALVSYQTGWLKANHPVEFMAAVMNLDMHLTEKLSVYRQELDRMEIALAPPDVNRSEAAFSVEFDDPSELGRIRYALGALKNVSPEAMTQIVEARRDGAFLDLFDFARRVPLKKIGKRALENLVRAGAFDSLKPSRKAVFDSLDTLIGYSTLSFEESASNQNSLFGDGGVSAPPPRLVETADWAPTERLSEEAAAVGFYLSGHPLDDYLGPMRRSSILTYKEALSAPARGGSLRIGGVVTGRQERKSQKGNKFAFVQLSDPSGMYEAVAFSETLAASRELLEVGSRVALTVEIEREGDQAKLRIMGVQSIDDAVAGAAPAGLRVYIQNLEGLRMARESLSRAAEAEKARQGGRRSRGPVRLVLAADDQAWEAELALPEAMPVTPEVQSALKSCPGVASVEEF
ncbi:MAG: DNA polymerase III subunit alpha [Pseudomonadota bacterium]